MKTAKPTISKEARFILSDVDAERLFGIRRALETFSYLMATADDIAIARDGLGDLLDFVVGPFGEIVDRLGKQGGVK